MARLILNDKVEDLIERVCEEQIKEEQLNYDHLVVSLRPKMDKVKYSNLKLNIVKNVALSYKLLGNFRYQSQEMLERLVRLMKNEVYSISEDLLDNFFYRNFTN